MRISLSSLSDVQIKNAHIIEAIAPKDPNYSQQLYGQESAAPIVRPGSPSHEVKNLEIEIDSSDPSQLQELLSRIEAVKGRLPRAVQELRKPS